MKPRQRTVERWRAMLSFLKCYHRSPPVFNAAAAFEISSIQAAVGLIVNQGLAQVRQLLVSLQLPEALIRAAQ